MKSLWIVQIVYEEEHSIEKNANQNRKWKPSREVGHPLQSQRFSLRTELLHVLLAAVASKHHQPKCFCQCHIAQLT